MCMVHCAAAHAVPSTSLWRLESRTWECERLGTLSIPGIMLKGQYIAGHFLWHSRAAELRQSLAVCRAWQNLGRVCRAWQDLAEFAGRCRCCRMWQNLRVLAGVLQKSGCVQGVAEAESRRAADAAEQAYRAAFSRSVSADEAALDAEHVRALAAAQAVFSEAAVGEPLPSMRPLRCAKEGLRRAHPSGASQAHQRSCYKQWVARHAPLLKCCRSPSAHPMGD